MGHMDKLTNGVVCLDVEVWQLEDPSDGSLGGQGGRGEGRDIVKLRDVECPVRGPRGALAAPRAQHHAADVATGQAVLRAHSLQQVLSTFAYIG